jgi:hypothetical protein
MNDNFGAGKIAAFDKNDKTGPGKKTNVVPKGARPNLSDSATSQTEKTSATETKVKGSDRRNIAKAMTRSSNPKQGRDRPRRDDERRQGGPVRSGRRNDGSYPRGGSAASSQGQSGANFSSSPSPQPPKRESTSRERSGYDKKSQGKVPPHIISSCC